MSWLMVWGALAIGRRMTSLWPWAITLWHTKKALVNIISSSSQMFLYLNWASQYYNISFKHNFIVKLVINEINFLRIVFCKVCVIRCITMPIFILSKELMDKHMYDIFLMLFFLQLLTMSSCCISKVRFG